MKDEHIVRRATTVDEKGKPIFIGPPFHIVGTNLEPDRSVQANRKEQARRSSGS